MTIAPEQVLDRIHGKVAKVLKFIVCPNQPLRFFADSVGDPKEWRWQVLCFVDQDCVENGWCLDRI
jgi:hypothetical protein